MYEQNKLYLSFTATSDVWTGLNDLFMPGMFMWSDHHMVTFTYWAPGEPNNHDGFSEDCVEMLHQVKRMEKVLHAIKIIFYDTESKRKFDHHSFEFNLCSRLDDGTTLPVQNLTPSYAKCPKLITHCPLYSPQRTDALRYLFFRLFKLSLSLVKLRSLLKESQTVSCVMR